MNRLAINTINLDKMATYLVDVILKTADAKQKTGKPFVIALAGGSSPKAIYQRLAQHKHLMQDWLILYSDERFLTKADTQRNENLFKSAFGDIPSAIKHMPCLASDQGTEAACLNHYQQLINNTEGIDICLLGIGEDGHTASLFENNLASNLANPEQVISINNADKYPPQRHSFNYSLIKQCRQVFLLACGATKSKALTEAYLSPGKSRLPIAQLIEHQQALNNVTILADREACKDLSGFIRLEDETMN